MSKKDAFYVSDFGIHGDPIITPKGRIAFVHLTEPNYSEKYKTSRYEFALLIDPETEKELQTELKKMCLAMAVQKYGTDAKAKAELQKREHKVFKDGNDRKNKETGVIYTGFEDKLVMDIRNSKREDFVLSNGSPEQFEAGVICRAEVIPFYGDKGFSYRLKSVRLIKDDGVRFSSAPAPGALMDNYKEAEEAAQSNSEEADQPASKSAGNGFDDL